MRKPIAENRLDILLDLIPDLCVRLTLSQVLRLLLDLLHLTLDVVLLPVVPYNTLQCVSVLDPLNQTCVSTEWHNGVGSKLQISGPRLCVILKHLVAQPSEIYESLLLAQITILIALEQKVVNVLIRSEYANLLWLFFAQHDGYFLKEARNHDRVLLEGREGGQRVLTFLTLLEVAPIAASCFSTGVIFWVLLRYVLQGAH